MTAEQFLLQSVRIREKLRNIYERKMKLEADLGYHPKQLDDSGASKGTMTDKTTDTLAEIVDLESEWEKVRFSLERKNNEIRQELERLDNVEYIAVLTERYITENTVRPCRLNSWVAVAFKLGLPNEDSARMMKNRALKAFEKKFKSVR